MKENIGTCPVCRKILLRRAELEAKDGNKMQYLTRCSHCQASLKVVIGVEILVYKYDTSEKV